MKIEMTYKIVSKYIKDLSFKIPDAKSYFLLEKNIRNYRVKIDVTSKKFKENIIEIDTNLYFEPKDKDKDNFKISILFSSLINCEKKIDGKELFYDYIKYRNLVSADLNQVLSKGVHTIELSVSDKVNNINTIKGQFLIVE